MLPPSQCEGAAGGSLPATCSCLCSSGCLSLQAGHGAARAGAGVLAAASPCPCPAGAGPVPKTSGSCGGEEEPRTEPLRLRPGDGLWRRSSGWSLAVSSACRAPRSRGDVAALVLVRAPMVAHGTARLGAEGDRPSGRARRCISVPVEEDRPGHSTSLSCGCARAKSPLGPFGWACCRLDTPAVCLWRARRTVWTKSRSIWVDCSGWCLDARPPCAYQGQCVCMMLCWERRVCKCA